MRQGTTVPVGTAEHESRRKTMRDALSEVEPLEMRGVLHEEEGG